MTLTLVYPDGHERPFHNVSEVRVRPSRTKGRLIVTFMFDGGTPGSYGNVSDVTITKVGNP